MSDQSKPATVAPVCCRHRSAADTLLTEGGISSLRVSVLAYISSLLLRTLPAIDYDIENFVHNDDESDPAPTPPSMPSAASPQTPENTAGAAANGDDAEEDDDDDAAEEEEEEGLDVEEEEDDEEDGDDAEDDDGETTYARSERASQIVPPTVLPPGEDFAYAAFDHNLAKRRYQFASGNRRPTNRFFVSLPDNRSRNRHFRTVWQNTQFSHVRFGQ